MDGTRAGVRPLTRLIVAGVCVGALLAAHLVAGTAPAGAATSTVSGTITRQTDSTPFADVVVDAVRVSDGVLVDSDVTDAAGAYQVDVDDGVYDLRVTPPFGSMFAATVVAGVVVAGPTTVDVVLVPQTPLPTGDPLTVSGVVYDGRGNPAPSQRVQFYNTDGTSSESVVTGADGTYSVVILSGDHTVQVGPAIPGATDALPDAYQLTNHQPLTLDSDFVLDVRIPAVPVTVNVTEPGGAPLANAFVSATSKENDALSLGVLPAYGSARDSATTDATGTAELWLFDSEPGLASFTARPPAGRPDLGAATVDGVTIGGPTVVDVEVAQIGLVEVTGTIIAGGAPVPFMSLTITKRGELFTDVSDGSGGVSVMLPTGSYEISLERRRDILDHVPPLVTMSTGSGAFIGGPLDLGEVVIDTVAVPISVVDDNGDPVANARVTTTGVEVDGLSIGGFSASGTSAYPPGPFVESVYTDDDGEATLWLFRTPPGAEYGISVVPPGSSLLDSGSADVTVPPAGSVEVVLPVDAEAAGDDGVPGTGDDVPLVPVRGRIVDRHGVAAPGIRIDLQESGFGPTEFTRTDADGSWELKLPPEEYHAGVSYVGPEIPGFAAPTRGGFAQTRQSGEPPLATVTGMETEVVVPDIPLPFLRVEIRTVIQPGAVPFPDVEISSLFGTDPDAEPFDWMIGGVAYPATGLATYRTGERPATTDAGGTAVLWLVNGVDPYELNFVPPAESGIAPIIQLPVDVVGDMVLQIDFQAPHQPPATTATATPPIVDESVVGGTTIELAAAAIPGFTISDTLYSLDGGPVTSYTGPFDVSALGSHVLRFWSVDSGGVTEGPQTLSFDVIAPVVNTAPTVDAGGPHRTAEGGATSPRAFGFDVDGDALTFAWDLDDDGAFDDATTMTVGPLPALDGPSTRTIRVEACDPSPACATSETTVEVTNVAPGVLAGADLSVSLGDAISATVATFSDPGTLDTHTATVDWGDGTGGQPASVAGSAVQANHLYGTAGTFTATVEVTDDDGGVGMATFGVTVSPPPPGAPRGTIVIVKDAQPDHPQDFRFDGDLGSFLLDDDSDGTLGRSRSVAVAPGSYDVSEAAVAGWALADIECNDPDGGSTTNSATRLASIDLDDGETVTCTFVNTAEATPPPPPAMERAPDTVGLHDPSTGHWHLRNSRGQVTVFTYGNPADQPFMGDWDCDGVDTAGLYRTVDGPSGPGGKVYLRNSNSTGIADVEYFFGDPGDIAVPGDWDGDGCDTVGLFRPGDGPLGTLFITNRLGSLGRGIGAAEISFPFGDPAFPPFAGDFDSDGTDQPGYHTAAGRAMNVFLFAGLANGTADHDFLYGNPGDRGLVGDWDGDGTDTIGVYRPGDAMFYLRNANTTGIANEVISIPADPTWVPLHGRFGLG